MLQRSHIIHNTSHLVRGTFPCSLCRFLAAHGDDRLQFPIYPTAIKPTAETLFMALFPGAHLQVSVRAREIRNEAREHSKRERGRVKEGHEGMCQT
jgi:hypothetical protein